MERYGLDTPTQQGGHHLLCCRLWTTQISAERARCLLPRLHIQMHVLPHPPEAYKRALPEIGMCAYVRNLMAVRCTHAKHLDERGRIKH